MERINRNLFALRIAAALLMLTAVTSVSRAQDNKHVVEPATWGNTPVSTAEMNRRVKEAAIEYQQYAPLPRIGFYDIAHPANQQEYAGLAGHAVMLVAVITQDQAELPLKRAYIEVSGKEVGLILIASVLSKQTDKQVVETLGAYRMDALYLLPLHLGFEKTDLMVDFAVNRIGFRLGTISGTSRSLKEGSSVKALLKQPAKEVLLRFIQREYPGFAGIIKKRD